MHHDHQTLASPALFKPLGPNVATVTQTVARSPRQYCDRCAGTFQVPVPGGASILMQDAADTSMALNVDIDPSSGTPILSGRAITAQGDVLDVHPCSCNDPISPRHNRPASRSPGHCCDGVHARDLSHIYPSPQSPPGGTDRRPAPIFTHTRTPLVLVQTRLPQSPSAPESQRRPEAPTPAPCADPLGSPFTPTPASVQRHSQGSNGADSFHTAQTCLEETPPNPPEPPHTVSPSRPTVPPRLDTLLPLSAFNPDFNAGLVESPSPVGPSSEVSGPSALGLLSSIPSPSYSASESSIHTIVPGARPVDDGPELTPSDRPEVTTQSADNAAEGHVATTAAVAADSQEHDLTSIPGRNTNTNSDLYTDRDVVEPSMPTAKIGPDGRELRFDLTTQLGSRPMTEHASPSVTRHSGDIKGTWVASLKRNSMALTLDLSLAGLSLQNLSLAVPGPSPTESPSNPAPAARPRDDLPVSPMHWTAAAAVAAADGGALGLAMPRASQTQPELEPQSGWEVETNSSQSIITFGSRPSTAPTLSDLPLTPIPELLHTPTKRTTPIITDAPNTTTHPHPLLHPSSCAHSTRFIEQQHLASKLPSPLDNEPILALLAQAEDDIGTIKNSLYGLANEWQNVVMMPDGVALREVEDNCAALYHALCDLSPIVVLTWPPTRQPSLGTEGGQPPAPEQVSYLNHMGEMERKWYLKQHEFTTSLQRNLTRLTLLAQRVCDDPDAAYRGNVLDRISQFTAKFEDIALRLKLAHHIRVEQKYRARVRHSARRAIVSPEQAAAHEYHKAILGKVREDIETIKHAMRSVGGP